MAKTNSLENQHLWPGFSNDEPEILDCLATRRSFCTSVLALGVGAVAVAAPVGGAVRMSLYPLEQTGLSGKEYELTTLDNLTETPTMFPVIDDIKDAWVSAPRQTIGNVFIRKITKEDGTVAVEAFQSVCPHAGCRIKIDTQKDPSSGEMATLFFCPCHGDKFYLNGERIDPSTSKSARSMDSLEARVDENNKVFVKFQNFRLGDAEKAPV